MARRIKKTDDEPSQNGTHDVSVADQAVAAPPELLPSGAPVQSGQPPNGEVPKNRPAASFAANSDRTTRIEVAVWAKVVKVSEQEEYTQYTLTLSRAWQKDGICHGNACFRIHDLPVLLFLAQQAYNWCVSRRTEVRIGDEPLPF